MFAQRRLHRRAQWLLVAFDVDQLPFRRCAVKLMLDDLRVGGGTTLGYSPANPSELAAKHANKRQLVCVAHVADDKPPVKRRMILAARLCEPMGLNG